MLRLAAALVAIAVLAASWRYGAFVAGGSDSYGYVSQSELWTRGELRVAQPIVRSLPPQVIDEALAPLGYKPARVVGAPGAIVPTYSPGLPMLMSATSRLFGPRATFAVVPVLGALGVWLTFILGQRLHGPLAGLLGAVALASSPVWLGHTLVPMSDVPVSTWWLAALLFASTGTRSMALCAGIATSLAVITRPNLVVLALPLAAGYLVHQRRQALVPLVLFTIGALPGPIVIALVNTYLYKSPFTSGYGPLSEYYAWVNIWPNLERYSRWLVTTEAPLYAFAPLAWWFMASPSRSRASDDSATPWAPRLVFLVALGTLVLVVASYLAYLPFNDWSYLRFLLPAYPTMFVLGAVGFVGLLERVLPYRPRGVVLATIVAGALVVLHGASVAAEHGMTRWRPGFERFRTVGRYIDEHLPPRAVVFAVEHSGSIRHYSGRLTLRFDMIDADDLEPIVAGLIERGFAPNLLLESWEEDRFRELFGNIVANRVIGSAPVYTFEIEPRIRLWKLDAPSGFD